MRIFLVLFALLFNLLLYSQNSGDCRTAIPVCADTQPISFIVDGKGDINDFEEDNYEPSGCLEKGSNTSSDLEHNTSWIVFKAGGDGQLGFDIRAIPASGSNITAEWDFVLYGPDVSCTDITNRNPEAVARCNFEANETHYTGLGVNPISGEEGHTFVKQSKNTYDEYIDVKEGELYYLLVNNYNTNFEGDPETFELTFTGSAVSADPINALDCTLRDEFLGIDIIACEGDPDVNLSALNSPAGPDLQFVTWSVDYDDDGVIDEPNLLSGTSATDFTVVSPQSGRYHVNIETSTGFVTDDILITFFGVPELDRVEILEDVLDDISKANSIEVFVNGDSSYEYSVNESDFQDNPVFYNVPVGINRLVINDKNGCATSEPIEFLVSGYPKFFTPNNDLRNDEWIVYGIEFLTDPVVSVFDRYGKLLVQLTNTTSGWDGTFNGSPLPSSDYWFRLDFERTENNVVVARTIHTHFTLKR